MISLRICAIAAVERAVPFHVEELVRTVCLHLDIPELLACVLVVGAGLDPHIVVSPRICAVAAEEWAIVFAIAELVYTVTQTLAYCP